MSFTITLFQRQIMDIQITSRTNKDFTVQVKIPYSKKISEFKKNLQIKLNEVEVIAIEEMLDKSEEE